MKTNKVATTSAPMQNENLEKLQTVFPNFVKDGQIDFDALKAFFDTEGLTAGPEKYGLSWAGKSRAFQAVRTPATGTLVPQREESKNWDDTENLFIEGDNLEVLKLLQKHYREKIKMIYIDPPYNTGKDFVYKDNFTQGVADYYEQTGQTQGGIKMSTNTEKNGRYHSDWLTMMYPRLFLARNLLKEDGVIFISIDDNEVANLRLIMDEIFGEENSLTESPTALIWQQSGTTAGHFANAHEYIICYAKNKINLSFFSLIDYGDDSVISHGALKKISKANPASEIVFPAGFPFEGTNAIFEGELGGSEKEIIDGKMVFENGKLVEAVSVTAGWAMKDQILSWIDGEETYDTKGQKILRFFFNKEGMLWYQKERGTVHPKTVLDKSVGTTKIGSSELEGLMGLRVFDFPKPVSLLKFLFGFTTKDTDIILDLFAGTGTTAHAVMELNGEDSQHRKWICVQLPETTDEDSEANKAGYKTISDISRERIRRAGEKISKGDIGFKSYKLAPSNYRQWREITTEEDTEALIKQSKLFTEKPLVDNFQEQNVAHEILLKEGFDLNTVVEGQKIITGVIEYYRATDPETSQTIYISFSDKITKTAIDQIGMEENATFVCFDNALDDTTKVNVGRNINIKTI